MKKLDNAQIFQLLWGCALLLMGIAFFFRIPEVMRSLSDQEHFFGAWYVRLSLYLVSILLIGGGGKKIYNLLYKTDHAPESPPDSKDV
ncbi:MAG: hypothetical protein R6T92_02205 [Desulfosalsimonadaceae bacterium]